MFALNARAGAHPCRLAHVDGPEPAGALGNVFDAVESTGAEGTRGEDLRTRVRVPRWTLGHPDGANPELGRWVDGAERLVQSDDDSRVPLHLPADFPDGGTLRLRGQGGVSPDGGPAGDLYLQIKLVDEPEPADAKARRLASLARTSDGASGVPATNDGPDLFLWTMALALLGATAFILFS
jgi:hypothetical protein